MIEIRFENMEPCSCLWYDHNTKCGEVFWYTRRIPIDHEFFDDVKNDRMVLWYEE
jgi:hypothetical protein